jgi:hypothetical protein
MRKNFSDFHEKYHGKVYVVYSEKEKIRNPEVIEEIKKDIA